MISVGEVSENMGNENIWGKQEREDEKFKKRIEQQNMKIAHFLWIVFLSMITSILTVLAATGR